MIPKLVKFCQYTCDQSPKGKCIRIYQDEAGWYYLHWLIRVEGFRTPFSSIEEIALSQGVTGMEVLSELELTEKMFESIKKSWDDAIKESQDRGKN